MFMAYFVIVPIRMVVVLSPLWSKFTQFFSFQLLKICFLGWQHVTTEVKFIVIRMKQDNYHAFKHRDWQGNLLYKCLEQVPNIFSQMVVWWGFTIIIQRQKSPSTNPRVWLDAPKKTYHIPIKHPWQQVFDGLWACLGYLHEEIRVPFNAT